MPVVSMKQVREESDNEDLDRSREQESESDGSSEEESSSSADGSDSEDSSGKFWGKLIIKKSLGYHFLHINLSKFLLKKMLIILISKNWH